MSSTQKDLKAERELIINELNRIGYIAVGMEQFPATDEEQFEYIQRIIDDSDYYVVIVRGRYGSLDSAGVSYTEKEFDYAIATGKPALAFLHADPGKLTIAETDDDPLKMEKLKAFRAKLEGKRIVRYWSDTAELISSIKDSVNDIARRRPGTGWIRGDQTIDPKYLQELERFRNENETLKIRLASLNPLEHLTFPPQFAGPDDDVAFTVILGSDSKSADRAVYNAVMTWSEIFLVCADSIFKEEEDTDLGERRRELGRSRARG